MLGDLVGTYQVIKGTEYLFSPPREVVGKCPRCGGEVAELQKGGRRTYRRVVGVLSIWKAA